MTFYVQYDADGSITGEAGFIMATVTSEGYINCDNQLIFGNYIDTSNCIVDPDTRQLVDINTGNVYNPDSNQFEPSASETGFWQSVRRFLGL